MSARRCALIAVLAGLALAGCGMYGDLYLEEQPLPEITEEPPIAAQPDPAEPSPDERGPDEDEDDGAGPR